MFGRLGMSELLVIFGIILLVLGPKKLPALAKSMGEAIKEFRKGTQDVTSKIEKFADETVVDESLKENK